MAKKLTLEELEQSNETFKKIKGLLKEKNVHINYPIVVNTSNVEKDMAWISCNYMSTGVKVPLSEIDFNDFIDADPEIFRHCATWSFIDKKR